MKLKLHEALMLGSMMNPKAIGIRHAPDGSTCALGAIEDSIGEEAHDCGEYYYPELRRLVSDPCNGMMCPLGVSIAMLNNRGNGDGTGAWSREKIADWLREVVEPQLGGHPTREEDPIPEPAPEQEKVCA